MAIKGHFCRLPPHLQACFPPPTTTKNKTGYQSAYCTDELDTLSDSSSLPNSARLIIHHAPTRRRLKKKKKKRLCIVFELFCLINNFMIWKRKKKERKKRYVWWWWQDSNPETMDYETRALPLSYQNQLHLYSLQNVYLYSIWRLSYDLRPVQSHNSNFDYKNLIKCIFKGWMSQNHNIMNLDTILWIQGTKTVSIRGEFATWKIPKPEHNSRTPS